MENLCATCGKELQSDQGFCQSCGSQRTQPGGTSPAAGAEPVASLPQPVLTTTPATSSGSGSSRATMLVVALMVLAIAVGAWIFLRRRPVMMGASSTPASTSASTSATASSSTMMMTAVRAEAIPLPAAPGASEPGSDALAAVATEAAAASKPCSLVTRAEMENIVGSKIVKVTSNDMTCSYFTDATLSTNIDTTWTAGKEAYAQVKGFNSAPGLAESIPNLGDDAYRQAAGVLHLLKGDVYVAVDSRVYPNGADLENAIARKALEKMK